MTTASATSASLQLGSAVVAIFRDAPNGIQSRLFYLRLIEQLRLPREMLEPLIDAHYNANPNGHWMAPPDDGFDDSVEEVVWPEARDGMLAA